MKKERRRGRKNERKSREVREFERGKALTLHL